ncbi:stathmin domain-containing protein 1 [Pristis pectinata]|uniref:stathmin domain-containing protein 1 n=1 Tax=Pristis pectinata TaxID=685728 RepID=UPI00223E0968|nr:stathmin domain-containing protein 1 [Pristis pectinata]
MVTAESTATTMAGRGGAGRGGARAPGDVNSVRREERGGAPAAMGCGTSRAVSTQSETGAEDSLERKRKIKNNRESSKSNVIDDLPRSRVSDEDLITLPGAVQQSLPPLRKPNRTVLRNGFNDDLALTTSSLLKKNGPINEIKERPRSAEILQELLVQGILNQAHNEEWQEVCSPLFVVKSTDGILKKFPSRLDKLRKETTKQKNLTIEEIEKKMMTEEERRKMKEVKLKERLNKFNSSVLTIEDQSTGKPTVPDHAKMEEIVEKITIKQKEIQQELQEVSKGKDRDDELDDRTGPIQEESKVNYADSCAVVELGDGHYLTTKPTEKVIVNKS